MCTLQACEEDEKEDPITHPEISVKGTAWEIYRTVYYDGNGEIENEYTDRWQVYFHADGSYSDSESGSGSWIQNGNNITINVVYNDDNEAMTVSMNIIEFKDNEYAVIDQSCQCSDLLTDIGDRRHSRHRIYANYINITNDSSNDSSNDSPNENSGIKSAYMITNGVQTDFTYAYYLENVYTIDGETFREVEIDFATIDLLYYYLNPEEIQPGIIFSEVNIDFGDVNSIPTGKITLHYENDFSFHKNVDLYEDQNSHDIEVGREAFYYGESNDFIISKNGNSYTMDSHNMDLIGNFYRDGEIAGTSYVTESFHFEGTLINANDLINSRSIQVLKVTDQGFANWLKRNEK